MRCSQCDRVIPPARLKAVPNATMCVPCLEAAGDVAYLRRLDDYAQRGNDLECEQTLFTRNLDIDTYMKYVGKRHLTVSRVAEEDMSPFTKRHILHLKLPLTVLDPSLWGFDDLDESKELQKAA